MSGIKRFSEYTCGVTDDAHGDYVLHSDHLASHSYDEAVERVAFEVDYGTAAAGVRYDEKTRQYVTDFPSKGTLDACIQASRLLAGWMRSAMSRAKRFGGAE